MIDFDTVEYVKNRLLNGGLEIIGERVRMKWQAYNNDGFTDMFIAPTEWLKTEDGIEAVISFGGLASWILEYGSGSKMTKGQSDQLGRFGNEWLDEYKNSPAWNQRRVGYALTGRSKGEVYYAPDGTRHVSSGVFAGLNLETMVNKKGKKVGGEYQPLIPRKGLHIIEQEVIAYIKELTPQIEKTLAQDIENEVAMAFGGDS